MDYEKNAQLAKGLLDYARELGNSDKLRLAAYVASLVNAIQQTATISQDAMFMAIEDMNVLFNDVEAGDPMEPGYHVHNMLENLAEDLEHLADVMDETAA